MTRIRLFVFHSYLDSRPPKMPGIVWADQKIVVAVYFSSLGVHQKLIPLLLELRGFTRTTNAIYNKMSHLRLANPTIGSPGSWNTEAAKAWVHEYCQRRDVSEDILRLTYHDVEILRKVCLLFITKDISTLIEKSIKQKSCKTFSRANYTTRGRFQY